MVSPQENEFQAFPVGFEPLEGIFDHDHYGHLMDEKSLSEYRQVFAQNEAVKLTPK